MKKTFNRNAWLKPINKPLRFVFVPKNVHPWYDPVKEGIERAITEYKQLGITVEIKWEPPSVADIDIHKKKIETSMRNRPDGLAIACLGTTTTTRLINEAIKAGLHVITFDTDAPESLRKTYVGHTDNYQDGYDLAEFLAERIHYNGKVGILTGTLTAPNHVGRVKGFKAGITQYKAIKIVFTSPDSDDMEQAENLTEMALKKYPDIRGFFCCNAINPIGCANIVKKEGKAGQIHIVGMDDLPETLQFIREGVIDAVKAQRQREIGYWAIVYLVALNQGHTIPTEHSIGTELITKEHL